MKVLVVGSGGREHALCWKLAQSPLVDEVFCAPGNAGTSEVATNLPVSATDLPGLLDVSRRLDAGLVVVGPEAPLVAGLADSLRSAGIPVFGPGASGAELEGSKAFAKALMSRHGIPTAGFRVFDDRSAALEYLEGALAFPVVVKASGLASGKGVLICSDLESATAAVDQIMVDKAFGAGGSRIVIEDYLSGSEASIHCVTDGSTLFALPTSQDHKRALDGDLGPNTGGMGAISPCPSLPTERLREVEQEVLFPTVHALRKEGRPFRGVIYAGLMLTRAGIRVLEYNARFGDPECQAILPRLRGCLGEILLGAAEGRLEELSDAAFDWDPRPSVTVVAAAEGYPASPRRGETIEGLEAAAQVEGVLVFHAGTHRAGGRVVTAGGRVLAVTALGADLGEARTRAYEALGRISYRGMWFRRDIGARSRSRQDG